MPRRFSNIERKNYGQKTTQNKIGLCHNDLSLDFYCKENAYDLETMEGPELMIESFSFYNIQQLL